MAAIEFMNWPATLEELAEGFINRLVGYDIKHQDAVRIFSKLYLKRVEKEHFNKVLRLKGDEEWDLEDFLGSLLEVE